MNAERILVIILASALAVFLVFAIIAIIKIIQLISSIKRLVGKAEHLAEAAESISENVQKTVSSFAIGRLVTRLIQVVTHKGSKTKSKGR